MSIQRGEALSSDARWQDKGQQVQRATQDIPSEHEKELLYHEGDRILD